LTVPSPSESSNEEPVFDRVAVHKEDFQGGPFPEQNCRVSVNHISIIDAKHDMLLLECSTSNSELDATPTMLSRSNSETESSFSFS
jgi:hypothetical protein